MQKQKTEKLEQATAFALKNVTNKRFLLHNKQLQAEKKICNALLQKLNLSIFAAFQLKQSEAV